MRIAVIGTGAWGKRIIKTLESLPSCSIDATATRDYAKLLERTDLDGIIIATPAQTHATIALDCINAGIPVFVEKPFATTVKDAKRVLALAKKKRVPVFVGHIHLYNPAFIALKKKLKHIGAIESMIAEGGGTDPARMDIDALWDWGPHSIAMMIDLVGKAPSRVRVIEAPRKKSTTTKIALTFPKSIRATATFSWNFPEKRQRLTVIGTKGTLTFDAYATQNPSATPPLTAELTAWLSSLLSPHIDPHESMIAIGAIQTIERLSKKTTIT